MVSSHISKANNVQLTLKVNQNESVTALLFLGKANGGLQGMTCN